MNRSIEEQLGEIRNMLNIILAYTYVSETTTLRDLYDEEKNKPSSPTPQQINFPKEEISVLVEYAHKTGKFKIIEENMVIEKEDGTTVIIPIKSVCNEDTSQ